MGMHTQSDMSGFTKSLSMSEMPNQNSNLASNVLLSHRQPSILYNDIGKSSSVAKVYVSSEKMQKPVI